MEPIDISSLYNYAERKGPQYIGQMQRLEQYWKGVGELPQDSQALPVYESMVNAAINEIGLPARVKLAVSGNRRFWRLSKTKI